MKNSAVKILVAISMIIAFNWSVSAQKADLLQQNDSLDIGYDIFEVNDPLNMEMAFDLKAYQKKNRDEYLKAKLTVSDVVITDPITKEVRLKPRGNSRRSVCFFPPMRLNIKKASIENEQLKSVKNIKIVTHCKNSKTNTNILFEEYLIYKMYEQLTSNSFRTRLIKMKYIDTEGRKKKELDTWAFMIEPEITMANRNEKFSVKSDRLGYAHCDIPSTDVMTMFQYMIGNADFSIGGRHNTKLLIPKGSPGAKAIPVPYDFDYSGIIDANYAKPGENLGLKSVTERYYLGPCRVDEKYNLAINALKSKKEAMYRVINEFEYLSAKEKLKMIAYLDSFFMQVDNKNFISQNIASTCK